MKKIFSRSWLTTIVMCIALLSVSCATPAIKKPKKPSGTTSTSTTSTTKSEDVGSKSVNSTVVVQKDTIN